MVLPNVRGQGGSESGPLPASFAVEKRDNAVSHPLYTAVAKTTGIRRLAAARIHQRVNDRFPRSELRTTYEPQRNAVVVRVRCSPWWYLTLGLYHARLWWRARQQVMASLEEVQSDVRAEVKWPTRKI